MQKFDNNIFYWFNLKVTSGKICLFGPQVGPHASNPRTMTVHLSSWLPRIILLVTVFHAAAEPEAADCLDSVWFVPGLPSYARARHLLQPQTSADVQTHTGVAAASSEKWEMSAMIIQKNADSVKAPPGGVVRMIQHVMPGSNLTAQLRINTNLQPSSSCIFSSFSARSNIKLLTFDGRMQHRGEHHDSTASWASCFLLQPSYRSDGLSADGWRGVGDD